MCVGISCTDSRHVGSRRSVGQMHACGARCMTWPLIVWSTGFGKVFAMALIGVAAPCDGSARVPSSASVKHAELLAGEQPAAAVEDLVEHRRAIGYRAADDLQHLGGGGLLLQRFLRLVEQPHVLDRDHRLVAEGLQQLELLVVELVARPEGASG